MQLFLLRMSELRMTVLPQRVSGQYSVDYTNENGSVSHLVRINAKDDKWYLVENKSVQISGANGTPHGEFREFELKENSLYYLRRDNRENMILMVEPETNDRRNYRIYRVPAGGVIDIGQAEYNQIQFINQYINEKRHLRIKYSDNGPDSVDDCEEEARTGRKNPAYLNGHRIEGLSPVKIGDVVFLFGLKIVLGKDFIAVNDPDHRTRVNLEHKSMGMFLPAELDEEEEPDNPDVFSSAPRARKEFIHRCFNIEQPPEGLQENDTPWIVMLGPSLTMAMGSLFSSLITINNILGSSGSVSSALPSLVTSIVMVMGSAVWPIIGRRVQHRSQVRKAIIASNDYEAYLSQLRDEIEAAKQMQTEILKENNPLLDDCIQVIMNVSESLWERSQRHKDFLEVMIGTGDIPLDAEFHYPERGYHSEISRSARDMYALVAKKHTLQDVPVTVPLKGAGIVGVIGDRPQVISFTKALLIELTAMHNYEDLKIIFIYDSKERDTWSFVKWIPHLWNDEHTVRYLANDADEVRNLSDYISTIRSVQRHGNKENPNEPHYLIFAADKTLAERAQAIKDLYQSPDEQNMTVIALYNERQHLPKACSFVIDLIHESERRKNPEKYDGVAATLADYNDITGNRILCRQRIGFDQNPEELFIQMSNIRLDSPVTTKPLPTQYTFMEMLEIGKPEHLDLIRRWRENSAVSSMAVPVGIDSDGYLINLDIHEKVHGAHGLIAGMTGSGKSEFIISYIAALAVNYSPEDVAFVLIDFKGGGMADIFRNLPHTAGLITNLDGNELKRSFLAIEHELEKRQKLFKEISEQKKISNIDINKYQKLRREDKSLKPLPHLVLITDEFAELKQQHGDFMGQLIRIARIGRSLGVHLILATQKPDGVVDDQIKSNMRFKVCLKVQDKSDSQSMIGRPEAALITTAGRFYFQVGHNEVFEYGQSPWSGAMYEPMEHAKKNACDYIEVLDEQGRVICRQSAPKGPRPAGIPEKQIDAIVQFISETAEQNQLKAEKLWLNPIPGPKAAKKKDTVYDTRISPFVLNPIVGVYDDLKKQKHLPLTVPFTTQGNALVYGTNGSGKLEFLNRMLVSIMEHHAPEEVNVYLCDYDSGSLAAFEDAAHTKAFVGAGDRTGVEEMLSGVIYELTDRRERMRKYGGDYQTYIATSGKTVPNVLLVIHNFQNLADTDPEARQKLVQIAREGAKFGIYLIMTGTTSNSIPYSMQPLFRNVYTLRQNSDDQYRDIVGKTGGIVPENFKGRGLIRVEDAVCEFQTGIVFEDAPNIYEAILRFCDANKRKWMTPDTEAAQAQEDTHEEAAPMQDETCEEAVPAAEIIPNDLTYTLDSLPLARQKLTGQVISYDLTASAATVICYDPPHLKQKNSILRAVQNALPENGHLFTLNAHEAELPQKIDTLWRMAQERSQLGAAAKKEGKPVPEFPPVVILVNEPSVITDTVDEIDRVHLIRLILNLTPGYRMYFVIVEQQDNLSTMLQGKCLSMLFPVTRGILLTTDKSAYVIFGKDVNFSGSPRVPLGFIVQNNIFELGEIIEL